MSNSTRWPRTTLGEVAVIVTGSTPSTSRKEYYGGTIPFVTPPNLDGTDLITDSAVHLTEKGAEQVRLIPANSVMVTCIGTLGKVAIAGTQLATNQQINSLIFDSSRVLPRYGYHYCRTLKPLLEHMAPATTVAIVNKTKFSGLSIPLPPLPEQRRIADILDKADAIRRKRERTLGIAEQMTFAIYDDLIGDPLRNTHKWPMTTLGERVDFVTGFAFQSSQYTNSTGLKLLRGANVLPDHVDWSDVCYWPQTYPVDERFQLVVDDVVLAMDRPWISSGIKVARVTNADLPCYLVQRVARLRSTSAFTPSFIYCSLRHPAFTTHCGSRKTETTVPHISPHDIRSFPVPDPPKNVQKNFEAVIKVVSKSVSRFNQALQDSSDIFNSLVQRAFRGEL